MAVTPAPTKDHVIKLRVTEVALAAWEAAARRDHRTLSDWIRARCEGIASTPPQATI